MSQQELADRVYVTQQTVSKWEQDDSLNDYSKIKAVAGELGVSFGYLTNGTIPEWVLNDEIFSPERMYTRMKTFAEEEKFDQTTKALAYAREKFEGKTRKTSVGAQKTVPYFIHPLMMACHAHAMGISLIVMNSLYTLMMACHAHAMGIRDDEVLAVILLHDVCEDCGVEAKDLPFDKSIIHSVDLLTKSKKEGETEDEMDKRYYAAIEKDSTASIVKAIDRCNNVSLMALSFTDEKLREYINETEKFVMPLIRHIKQGDAKYNDAAFLITYQLRSSIETIKSLLMRNQN